MQTRFYAFHNVKPSPDLSQAALDPAETVARLATEALGELDRIDIAFSFEPEQFVFVESIGQMGVFGEESTRREFRNALLFIQSHAGRPEVVPWLADAGRAIDVVRAQMAVVLHLLDMPPHAWIETGAVQ